MLFGGFPFTNSILCVCVLQVEGLFYVNDNLKRLMYDELKHHCASQGQSMWQLLQFLGSQQAIMYCVDARGREC